MKLNENNAAATEFLELATNYFTCHDRAVVVAYVIFVTMIMI